MARSQKKTWTALCALMLLTPLMNGAISPATSFGQRILVAHNYERLKYGIEPLRWNAHLAYSAQKWANYLAATGRFEHAPDDDNAPQGENLWAGTRGYYTLDDMVGAWIDEKRFFKPGRFPNNSTTGNVEDVGHFTQVVWRETGEVGCAKASNQEEDILVCRYSDAGNYIGERPF